MERGVEMQAPRALIGETGDDIEARAVERVMIGEHGGIGASCAGDGERRGERAGE
jgi:hypothetical protein